jgi:autotransporter translocation and assembly factor TamB
MIRRGLRIAFLALALLVVLALAVGAVVWQTRRPALAGRLEELAQSYLIGNDSTRIDIGNISGNPLGALKLHDVSLLVRDGKVWTTFLTARSIKVDFSVSKVSRRGVELEAIEIERPVFSLERGTLGEHLWPRFKKKGASGGPGFTVDIKRLGVRQGLFKIDRRKDDVFLLDIDLVTSLKRDASGVIALNGLAASFGTLPWKYSVEKLQGNLFFKGSSIGLDSIAVATPSSSYSVRGRYAFGEEKEIDLDVLIEKLSLEEMRRFDKLSFLPEEGELAGRASVTQKGKGPTVVECRLAGAYGTHPLESLEASTELGRKRWQSEFRLLSGESILEGTFSAQPESLQECAIDFKGFDPGDWPEVFGQKKIPHGSLDGAFRFSGKSLTSPERAGAFEVMLDSGNYAGFSFLHASANGEFDGQGGLLFPAIEFVGTGYSATATGSVGPKGVMEFEFDSRVESLGEFSWVKNQFEISGDLRANGRVQGDGEKLLLGAALEGPLDSTSPRTVNGFMKAGVVRGQLWPVFCIGTTASFAPASLFGFPVDSLEARAFLLEGRGKEREVKLPGPELPRRDITDKELPGQELPDSESPDQERLDPRSWESANLLMMANLHAFRKDSSLTAEASVRVNPGATQADLTQLEISTGSTHWTSPKPVRLDWEEGSLRVAGLKLTSQEGNLSFDGSFEPRTNKASGKLEANLSEVSVVLGRFMPVAGKLDGCMEFELKAGSTRLGVEVDWKDASLSGRKFDRLSLSAAADDSEIQVRELSVVKGRGKVDVAGKLSLPAGLVGLVDTLSARHSLPAGTSAELTLDIHDLELSQLADWHPSLDSLGGRFNGSVQVEGALEEPQIRLALEGTDVRIKEYEVSGIDAEATLAGRVCTISRLELVEKNAKGVVRGSFPLLTNLCKGSVRIADGALDLDVQLSESDFSVASLFIKQIASSSGLIKGSVRMTGTVRDPNMEGGFQVTNATLRMAGREEVLEHLDAQVKLDEKAVELIRFSATQGADGRLDGSGRIYIGETRRGEYSFVVKGKKITFGDPEDMAMKFDCDLVISSVEVKDRGTFPRITGRIDVRQGIIAREFETGVSAGGESRWLCDVELEVPNNLWLKSINAEIELAGSLTARKDIGGMILLGSLRILRGKYYIFDNEFRIVSGNLEFKDVGRIDPELSIEAETNASGRRIFLSLSGKLSEPNIRFTCEDENLTQAEVLRLLTLGKYVDATPGQTTEGGFMPGVTGSVGNYFLRQIERRVARELKWVDSIELGGSLEGGSSLNELRWGLGKYVTPELYLRYSQGLVKTSERDVSIEYRLSELLFLRGGVISKDRLTGKDRDEYTLDLRLKYEY